jgi:hypothetical protein
VTETLPSNTDDLWGPEEAEWDRLAPSAIAEAPVSAPPDTPPEHPPDDDPDPAESFWRQRRALQHIHTFARARRVAPWAVLGSVLNRVICCTPPNIQLPATIGSYASLNLFVALSGESGGGKDASGKVARDCLDLGAHAEFLSAPLGSGEGLSHMFMRDNKGTAEQYNTAALVSIGEIDTMTALAQRHSSTVGSQLRQAAMGEQLGFFYVDVTKRMMVPEHRYRLCLLANVQPKRAGALMGEADGGTPQRFIWMPVTDPGAPDVAPDCPAPMVWVPPDWSTEAGINIGGMYRIVLRICQTAIDTVIAAHLARRRGEGNALDGHSLLTRLKVAAAFAILEGRTAVLDDDWALAGAVMEVSDQTRAEVQRVLDAEQRKTNKAQAEAEAARTILIDERRDDAKVRRVARNIKRHLGAAGAEGMTHSVLRKVVASKTDRAAFDAALAALILTGEVVEQVGMYHSQPTRRYRLAEASS